MKKNLLFFFTGICLSIVFFTAMPILGKPGNQPHIDTGVFVEVKDILSQYLPTPSQEVVHKELLHSFVSAYGDKYTTYFSPDEVEQFNTLIQGDFEGIGAYIDESDGSIFITDVIPGSPAQQGGLLPGDIIQSVDGVSTHDKTANEVVSFIRGKANTPVTLSIFSTMLSTKKQVTLFRKHLEIPIISDSLEGTTLYIHLLSFNDYSRDDIQEVLDKHAGKYKHILLDLRDNGGGTLASAVEVGSLFLHNNAVIATVEGVENESYFSYGDRDSTVPISILVNGQTASAAEILASALHHHLKSPIYGSETYGKGSVQQIFGLSNGGEVKVTIAHWRTAEGTILDQEGITPGIIILPSIEDIVSGTDGQLQKTLEHINKNT